MKEAFTKADNVLATAAKCITDVINSRGHIIVDFADVCTVMKNGGVAILGKAEVEGENRAQRAIEEALNSPLLNDNDIRGAKWILLNINSAEGDYECTMDELETINDFLRERTGEHSDVIMGMGYDATLGQKLGITLIATGFEHKDPFQKQTPKKAEAPVEEKIVMTLLSEETANETNNLMTAPTEAVAETPTEEPKTEEPTIADGNFTLGEEIVEAVEEVAEMMEVEEVMSIHEVDEISEKEYEAEIDAQISIAANEVMEEMVSQPIVFEINDVYEGEDLEEEEEVVNEVEEEVIVASFQEEDLEEEIVLNEIEEEQVEEQVEEEVIVSELVTPMAETNHLVNHFILTKPTNIYAEHTEEEPSIEEMEEIPVVEEMEEMEEFDEMEEEEMVELEEMEEMVMQDDLAVTMQEIVEEEIIQEDLVEEELVEEELVEEEIVEEEIVEVAEITMQAAPVQEPVVYESSFRMEEEPTMQLVMREESSFNANQNNAKRHPSSLDMPMDDAEEQRRKVAERIQKLRNLSFNINSASDPNNEFDAVPAYVRRNLDLFGNTMASVENYYSKYTVEKDENNQTQISTINTFLDGKKPD